MGFTNTQVTQAQATGTAAPSGSSLGSASLIGAGASAITGMVASYYSAKTTKLALDTQAFLAGQNARIAELGAQAELQRGEQAQQSIRLRGAQVKSAQRVALAANGVDLGSQSAVNALTSTDYMTEVDANTAATNALRAAWGYRTQGTNFQNEALMKSATASGISPVASAAGSLLSGASNVASAWYTLNKAGATPDQKGG